MELEQAKNRLEELRPANPALEGASVIDVSLGAVMSRYRVEGPVCHVGSKLQHAPEGAGRGASFRRLFSGLRDNGFTGLDIEPGENVDVLADICDSNFEETHPELCQRFGFALVLALLEHVPDPFRAALNITSLLRSGGYLFYSGPWAWDYHMYPDDYWRFHFPALRMMFKNIDWKDWWFTGTNQGVGLKLADPTREGKVLRVPVKGSVGEILSDIGMPYLLIGAIGEKR